MRQAARRGIVAAGCDPVLVNEDFPSSPDSPRNACLDGVESSDAMVVIVGARGGSRAPSGKLIVEEELDHARLNHRPVFAFLQDVTRDADAESLAHRLSGFVEGHNRSTFGAPAELESAITRALKKYEVVSMSKAVTADNLMQDLTGSGPIHQEPWVRLAISPQRDEEVIDIVRLEEKAFEKDVYRIAHDVDLFAYEAPKRKGRTTGGVRFSQADDVGRRQTAPETHVEIQSSGRLLIDQEIERGDRNDFLGGLVIVERDLEAALRSSFEFSSAFFEWLDPHQRHSNLWYGTALANSENRTLTRERPRGSFSMGTGIGRGQRDLLSPELPRLISRIDHRSPEREIERILTLYRRTLPTS